MPSPFKELQAKGRIARVFPPVGLYVPECLLQPFKEYEERMARERMLRGFVDISSGEGPTYKQFYDSKVAAMMTWRPNKIPVYVGGVQLGFTNAETNLQIHKLILDMKPTKKVKKAEKLAKKIAKLLSFVQKTTFYKLISEDETGATYHSAAWVHASNADMNDVAEKAKKLGFTLCESDLKEQRLVYSMSEKHVTTKDIFGSFHDQKEIEAILEVVTELVDEIRGHKKQVQNLNLYHANTLIRIGNDIYNVEHDGEFEYMGEALTNEPGVTEPIFEKAQNTTNERDKSPY